VGHTPVAISRTLVARLLICIDAIVERPNFVVRHHRVNKADVYVLPAAVGIAQAGIDPLWLDLRLADAASMLTDAIRKCLRTSTD
jgi:hypothetical protein